MLTYAGVREQKEGAVARDVLNEKPQNEFLAAATTAKASNLGKGAGITFSLSLSLFLSLSLARSSSLALFLSASLSRSLMGS